MTTFIMRVDLSVKMLSCNTDENIYYEQCQLNTTASVGPEQYVVPVNMLYL